MNRYFEPIKSTQFADVMKRKYLAVIGIGGFAVVAGLYGSSRPDKKSSSSSSYFQARLFERRDVNENAALLTFHTDPAVSTGIYNNNSYMRIYHVNAVDSGNIYRPYSPIFVDKDINEFSLLVKRYKYGYFSNLLHKLPDNSLVGFFGVKTVLKVEPKREGKDSAFIVKNIINGQAYEGCEKIVTFSTGSAIAPMIQLAQQFIIVRNGDNNKLLKKMKMIHFARGPEEILLLDELKILVRELEGSLEVVIVLKDFKTPLFELDTGLSIEKGTIDMTTVASLLSSQALHSGTCVIVSGGNSFLSKLCGSGHEDGELINQPPLGGIIKELGFLNAQVFRL